MKTTIDLSDDLLMRAKRRALERRTTLREVIEQALEASLGGGRPPVAVRTIVWPPAGSTARETRSDIVLDAIRAEREGAARFAALAKKARREPS